MSVISLSMNILVGRGYATQSVRKPEATMICLSQDNHTVTKVM